MLITNINAFTLLNVQCSMFILQRAVEVIIYIYTFQTTSHVKDSVRCVVFHLYICAHRPTWTHTHIMCLCASSTYFDVWNNDAWQHAINASDKVLYTHTEIEKKRVAVILNWLCLTCDQFGHAIRVAVYCVIYLYFIQINFNGIDVHTQTESLLLLVQCESVSQYSSSEQ